MMIALHKNATTTPAVRAQIQQSSASEYELAEQYGISRTTVQRWKHRDCVEDRSRSFRLGRVLTSRAVSIAVAGGSRAENSGSTVVLA
jgi:ribosome-binding protein aMBF1 (putative translation factor)